MTIIKRIWRWAVARPTPEPAITTGSISELGQERGNPFARVRRLRKRREFLPANRQFVGPTARQITTL
jgi:hypothetical protein